MPMYWDAYLADTTHLTTEEHGAYLLLLAAMWRRDGSVPDNDKDNARILGLSLAKWRKIKQRLSPFLTFENESISQKNLQKIWEKTQEKIQKNKQNGAKGGRPKSNDNNDLAKPNGFNSVNPNESIPYPYPEPEPKDDDYHHLDDDEKNRLDLIEAKLRRAAKLENSPAPMLFDISPILMMMKEGFDIDRQIIPVIKKISDNRDTSKITSWKYFATAIKNESSTPQGKSIPKQNNGINVDKYTPDMWRAIVLPVFARRKTWLPSWGPEPGEEGCKVPLDLINEFENALG